VLACEIEPACAVRCGELVPPPAVERPGAGGYFWRFMNTVLRTVGGDPWSGGVARRDLAPGEETMLDCDATEYEMSEPLD
jgi:hypothetical protein